MAKIVILQESRLIMHHPLEPILRKIVQNNENELRNKIKNEIKR